MYVHNNNTNNRRGKKWKKKQKSKKNKIKINNHNGKLQVAYITGLTNIFYWLTHCGGVLCYMLSVYTYKQLPFHIHTYIEWFKTETKRTTIACKCDVLCTRCLAGVIKTNSIKNKNRRVFLNSSSASMWIVDCGKSERSTDGVKQQKNTMFLEFFNA